MEIEHIVLENSKNIAKNTANLAVVMKIMYFIIAGIIGQVVITFKNFITIKKNK